MLITKLLRFPLTSIIFFFKSMVTETVWLSTFFTRWAFVFHRRNSNRFGMSFHFWVFNISKQQYIFTKLHNIYVLSHKYVFCPAFSTKKSHQTLVPLIKLLWSFFVHSMIVITFVMSTTLIKFQKVWVEWKWMRMPPSCVPPPTHTLLCLSFLQSFSLLCPPGACPHRKLWHLCL